MRGRRYFLVRKREFSEKNNKVSFALVDRGDMSEWLHALKGSKWKCFLDYRIVPAKPGVYGIVITDKTTNVSDLAYIGSSGNINRRLYSHTTLFFLRQKLAKNFDIKIFAFFIKEGYKSHEKNAISLLKPFLNPEIEKKVFI